QGPPGGPLDARDCRDASPDRGDRATTPVARLPGASDALTRSATLRLTRLRRRSCLPPARRAVQRVTNFDLETLGFRRIVVDDDWGVSHQLQQACTLR